MNSFDIGYKPIKVFEQLGAIQEPQLKARNLNAIFTECFTVSFKELQAKRFFVIVLQNRHFAVG